MEKRRILGVDIGSEAVKVLVGTVEREGNVSIFANGSAPMIGFAKGRIGDVSAIAYAVKQAIDSVVMTTERKADDYIFVGLSGAMLRSRNECLAVADPKRSREELERQCREMLLATAPDTERIIHVLPRLFSDSPPGVSQENDRQKETLGVLTHVVSAENAVLESLEVALRNVGIPVDGVVANGVVGTLQIFNGVNHSEPVRYLFLDIGAGTIDWAIYDRSILASGCLPLGGEYITKDIMQGIGVSRTHAEEIKRYYARLDQQCNGQNVLLDCNDYGTADKNVPYDFLYDIVESRVEEIVQLLADHLAEEVSVDVLENISQIYLSGGCSALPSVGKCLGKILKAPAQVIQPRRTNVEYARPGFMACVGILQYAARHLPIKPVVNSGRWNSVVSSVRKIFG